ncbi:MAG: DMT family transporter [Negativicutes bacterium]|nr:DMT family transporter [Negativicutes bacterium]
MRTGVKGAVYLSVAASIWGGMYIASKYTLAMIPPFTLLFIRYFLASVILVVWCRRSQVAIMPRQDRWLMFQIGFMGYFLSVATQFIGTKLSSAHMGAVITTLSPVFQSGFAILLLGEMASRRQVVSLGLSIIGVAVITNAVSILQHEAFNTGNLFFLVAAILWGYYSVLAKKADASQPTLRITTWGILVATLCALPPAAVEWGSWETSVLGNGMVIFSILYLAAISTTVAYYCWNKGLALTTSHQAGLFIFLQPVVGSILGYSLLGEELSPSFFAGTVLILIAVYLSIASGKEKANP